MVQARRGDDDVTTKDYAFFHSPKFKICFLSMWWVCIAWTAFSLKMVWRDADAFNTSFNVVLFALDQFIITVAVPQIVSEFDALDQGGSGSSPCPGKLCRSIADRLQSSGSTRRESR
jgi:hypothetical protein